MRPVVGHRLVFVVIGPAPDSDVEGYPILRWYLVRLLFKLPPFFANIVNVKSRAFGVPLEQFYEGHSILLVQG
jgi:hypothetical protein